MGPPNMKAIISATVLAMSVSAAALAQQPAPTTAGPAEIFTRLPSKSATHKAFGFAARNCRFTRSSGEGAARSLTVVFTALPRIAPANPICRISRAVVQRATATPSRRSCRQTLRPP